MPKVSVIIPSFNHARYLAKRIETVLNQTYTDFELLILDDRSTDASVEVIERYARRDPRVSFYLNEVNSGCTFLQWRKGVSLAKGEYVWVAESDDFADLSLLEALVPALEANSQVGIAYSNSVIVDEDDVAFDSWASRRNNICQTEKWSASYTGNGLEEIKTVLLYNCTINNASAVLMRRSLLLPHLDTIATFRYVGDWYAYMAMLLQVDIAYVHQDLNFYREHRNNVSLQSYGNGMQFYERYRCRSLILPQLALPGVGSKRIHQDLAYEYLRFWRTFFRSKNLSALDFLKLEARVRNLDRVLYGKVIATLAGTGFRKVKKEVSRLWSR